MAPTRTPNELRLTTMGTRRGWPQKLQWRLVSKWYKAAMEVLGGTENFASITRLKFLDFVPKRNTFLISLPLLDGYLLHYHLPGGTKVLPSFFGHFSTASYRVHTGWLRQFSWILWLVLRYRIALAADLRCVDLLKNLADCDTQHADTSIPLSTSTVYRSACTRFAAVDIVDTRYLSII